MNNQMTKQNGQSDMEKGRARSTPGVERGTTMKIEWRRIISLMLTITMLMGMLPTNAIAELVATPSEPKPAPTVEATVEPTVEPTAEVTVTPTAEPTAEATVAPTAEVTVAPTAVSTAEPTPYVPAAGDGVDLNGDGIMDGVYIDTDDDGIANGIDINEDELIDYNLKKEPVAGGTAD